MKKLLFILLVQAFFFLNFAETHPISECETEDDSFVYLHKGPNRLGDTLMRYVVDKNVSICLNIPLYYDPFEYSERLNLSKLEYSTKKFKLPNYQKKRAFNAKNLFVEKGFAYFGLLDKGYLSARMIHEFKQDLPFIEYLRKAISPIEKLPLIYPPKDIFSAAVHIRKGLGFDGLQSSRQLDDPRLDQEQQKEGRPPNGRNGIDCVFPLKFPPEQYYVDQIKELAHQLDYQPLYVFIFTDHPNPSVLTYRIKRAVGLPNITYGCRQGSNRHDQNVLIDLFSMSYNFDSLIRPGDSAFSIIAHLLGDHQVVIYPTTFKRSGNCIKIVEAQLDINEKHY